MATIPPAPSVAAPLVRDTCPPGAIEAVVLPAAMLRPAAAKITGADGQLNIATLLRGAGAYADRTRGAICR